MTDRQIQQFGAFMRTYHIAGMAYLQILTAWISDSDRLNFSRLADYA